jgi:hypothetical protein
MAQPSNKVEEPLTSFRASLEDARDILMKLGPFCSTLDDAIRVFDLGATDESQARFLYNLMFAKDHPP